MASVADVLRHLLAHTPALSADGQAELLAAVDAEPVLAADRAAPAPPAPAAALRDLLAGPPPEPVPPGGSGGG